MVRILLPAIVPLHKGITCPNRRRASKRHHVADLHPGHPLSRLHTKDEAWTGTKSKTIPSHVSTPAPALTSPSFCIEHDVLAETNGHMTLTLKRTVHRQTKPPVSPPPQLCVSLR